MKACNTCNQPKPLISFSKKSKSADGHQPICKTCFNTYRKRHYENNKQRYRDWVGHQKEALKQEYLTDKSQGKCTDCGQHYPNEPWLMEYDHTDDTKTDNVSKLVQNGSTAKFRKERHKCELVCVLCHRRRTAKRAGWVFIPSS